MLSELDTLFETDGKILFAGIGNLLRSDDGAGPYISNRIKKSGRISSITVEVSIENYIGKINKENPDILVLIDCADMKTKPGSFRLLQPGQVMDTTFNTHSISLNNLPEFFSMPVFILGIQPEKTIFGEGLSKTVRKAADIITNHINQQEVHHG